MHEDMEFLARLICSSYSHPARKIRVGGLTFARPGALPGPPCSLNSWCLFRPSFPTCTASTFLLPLKTPAVIPSVLFFSSPDLRPFISPARCAMPINLSKTTCSVLIGAACCHHCYFFGSLSLIQVHMQRTSTWSSSWNFEGLFSFVLQLKHSLKLLLTLV